MMTETYAISVKEENCSLCSVCSSVCPFDAIEVDEERERLILDVEKCQVCGLCHSACPASAIELLYYAPESLLSYVEKRMKETGFKTLAVVCRGVSPPPSGKVMEFLAEQGFENYILLRVPCTGRVPPEFYLKALRMGIEKVVVVQCEDEYCRFKRGSEVSHKRLDLLSSLLETLGFPEDTVVCYTNPMKPVYVTENCVGCGKCGFICPYDAIEIAPGGTPTIDPDLCVGCGACGTVCPHKAIYLDGYDYDSISERIHKYASLIKTNTHGKPAILAFVCQWSEFSALDEVRDGLYDENVAVIEIPCLKGLDPAWVVEALLSGFDGVLVVVCPEDACKLEKGTEIAENRVVALKKLLYRLRMDERFEIHRARPVYPNQFRDILADFSNRISNLIGR